MTATLAALYVGVGRTLLHYSVDAESCTLQRRGELFLPNGIQYGWQHADLPVLYVSCGAPSQTNSTLGDWACALILAPGTGVPSMHGVATRLSSRALHLSTDRSSENLLLAHNRPAGVSIFRIDSEGALAGEIDQRLDIDPGIFPHQVLVTPDNRFCLCVARGNPQPHEWKASIEAQVRPGSLQIFEYDSGVLGYQESITIDDGYHFGPRNLDFYGPGPWVYLGLETQNEVVVLEMNAGDGAISLSPLQRLSTLENPAARVHQGVGPVLVHPQRNVLYVANRAYQPGVDAPKIISADAENSIVVFEINVHSGLLTEIQRIDSGGVCPRTLSLDPTGQMLVVANSEAYAVGNCSDPENLEHIPMNLSTFSVLSDGRLELRHQYVVSDGDGSEIAWAGIATFDAH